MTRHDCPLALALCAFAVWAALVAGTLASPARAQSDPTPAPAPEAPLAPPGDPLDPSKVTVTQSVSPSPPAWGKPLTYSVTLKNGNTPTYEYPEQDILCAPGLTYTAPDGTAQTVGAVPSLTVVFPQTTVNHAITSPALTVRLPAYLSPPAALPDGVSAKDNGDGTFTASFAFGALEGGSSQTLALTLTPDPRKLPGAPAAPASPPPPVTTPVTTPGPATPTAAASAGVAPPPFPAAPTNALDPAMVPVYALHSSKERFFTVSLAEQTALVRGGAWTYEGVCGFLWPADGDGRVAVLRAYNPTTGLHLFTTDASAEQAFITIGARAEGVTGYAPAAS